MQTILIIKFDPKLLNYKILETTQHTLNFVM